MCEYACVKEKEIKKKVKSIFSTLDDIYTKIIKE